MQVVSMMSENEVGFELLFYFFEELFYLSSLEREKTSPKILDNHVAPECPLEKIAGALHGLTITLPLRAENDPIELALPAIFHESKECAPTTNFNVIGMRPET